MKNLKIDIEDEVSLFIKIILFISLFSSSFVFFRSPFEFYFHYLIFISLTPFLFLKVGIPKFLFYGAFAFLIIGLLNVTLSNNSIFNFVKIFLGLLLSTYFFYSLLYLKKFNVKLFFNIYCKLCLIVSFIGLLQVISFFINFKYGFDYSWILNKWGVIKGGIVGIRVNSILAEPSQLGIVLSPALFVSVRNLIKSKTFYFKRWQSLLIIVIVILTTSTIAYFGLLLIILINTKSFSLRYITIGLVISVIGYFIAYRNVNEFKLRVDAAKGLWIEENFDILNTNNSSFVLYNNFHIAKQNLLNHPLFGTGLGSHETAFKNFSLTKKLLNYKFEFNVKDGNSLFIRLCTETGLIGIILVMFFCAKNLIIESEKNEKFEIKFVISNAIFILIVLSLLRQGNYMLNGLPLMFLMYYYNNHENQNQYY